MFSSHCFICKISVSILIVFMPESKLDFFKILKFRYFRTKFCEIFLLSFKKVSWSNYYFFYPFVNFVS